MFVRAIHVDGFRNLESTIVEPGNRFNVFSGNNGQGKTNLLEALYAVCTLRSFRTSRLRDVIDIKRNGEDNPEAYVGARVKRQDLERKYELRIHPRSKIVRLDDKAVRPISRYFGQFNVVLFAPEDLLVARASPGDRRRFLDRAVFTSRPEFLASAQEFEKVLRSRNHTLKNETLSYSQQNDLLEVYDGQLANAGAAIVAGRQAYLAEIQPGFAEAFAAIAHTGMATAVSYESTLCSQGETLGEDELASRYREALGECRSQDLARKVTSLGPHRDVLQFRLADQDAGGFASQGQLRAMILAWKSAEMELLATAHQDPPVLLLDDVSSELDEERNGYLFDFLRTRENQCFITTTHPKHVLLSSDRRDFWVEGGRIERSSMVVKSA